MKNYDNNQNIHNYRTEDKKKKKAHNLLWLLLLLLLLAVAIVTVIIVGITNSWFSFSQKMEGDITFENGIVMSYEGMDVQQGSNFKLLKKVGNDYSPLNETQVRFDDVFTIANPKLSAAKGSTNFVLRAKLDYTFTKDGYDGTLNLTSLANALNEENGTTYYNANNVLSAIYKKTLTFANGWLDGGDGWFYYVGSLNDWTNSTHTPNFADMSTITPDTSKISIFDAPQSGEPTIEVIEGEGNDMETFFVKSCKVTLTINACEANSTAFNSWLILG